MLPPKPPLPPTLWAKRPKELLPETTPSTTRPVLMDELLTIVTLPALPPLPPLPPTLAFAFTLAPPVEPLRLKLEA